MTWILGQPLGIVQSLVAQVMVRPGNPKFTEVRVRGSRCVARVGLTPRLAVIRNPAGLYDVGIPDDGWSQPAVMALSPGASYADNRPTYTI